MITLFNVFSSVGYALTLYVLACIALQLVKYAARGLVLAGVLSYSARQKKGVR